MDLRWWRLTQVAAGENPCGAAERCPTDISQGREMTPEGELKNEAPARAYSTISVFSTAVTP